MNSEILVDGTDDKDIDLPLKLKAKRHWSFIAVIVFILIATDLMFFLPIGYQFVFTFHVDQIFLFIAVGFPCLISEIKNKKYSVTIMFAFAFLIFSCFSAIFSTQAYISFFGIYIEGTGWLFYLACICAWAAGIKLVKGNISKQALMNILTAGAIFNSLFSVLQMEFSIHNVAYNGLLQTGDFAASGIFGNPVYFAQFITAVLVMNLFRNDISIRARGIIAIFLGFGIELSGDRMAVVIVVLAGIIVMFKKPFKFSLQMGISIISGYLVGFGVDRYFQNSPLKYQLSTSSLGTGFSARFVLWKLVSHRIISSPFFGKGPESTLRETLPFYTSIIAKQLNITNGLYGDSHNFILELLLSVGIVGFIPLVIFFIRQIKLSRGPLAYFVVASIPFALIEPLNIMVDLAIMVSLGASTVILGKDESVNNNVHADQVELSDLSASAESRNVKSVLNIASGLLLFLALICSVLLVADDAYYAEAPNTYFHIKVVNQIPTLDFTVLNYAISLMPIYARYYYEYGKAYGVLAGLADKRSIAIILAKKGEPYIKQAQVMSPYNPRYSDMMAQLQIISGDNRSALSSYELSLRNDPFDSLAASESCYLGYELKSINYKSLCDHMIVVTPGQKMPWVVKPRHLY